MYKTNVDFKNYKAQIHSESYSQLHETYNNIYSDTPKLSALVSIHTPNH